MSPICNSYVFDNWVIHKAIIGQEQVRVVYALEGFKFIELQKSNKIEV